MASPATAPDHSGVVSFDSEELILVNEDDREIGHLSKDKCHNGEGVLHRAFSLFILNPEGQLLLQQRGPEKRLWPGYWSNSCCSHPRRGESMEQAIHRRLYQELGMRSALTFLFKFIYHAQYRDLGSEHELCWVYAGRSDDNVSANPNEIAAWRYMDIDELDRRLRETPDEFTPWIQMEWEQIGREFRQKLELL